MSLRHKGRELALQYLYCWALNPESHDYLPEFILETNNNQEDIAYFFALLLLNGVIDNISEIDEVIKPKLKHWSFDRLAKVDLALQRLSTYELLFQKDTPDPVIMNEAILLSKEFCGEKSYKFINGVLEAVILDRKGEK